MEVSALTLQGGTALHGRSPFLRLQSDERLVALVRRGNLLAFELLVSRYQTRLLAFCRHMLGSHEDAEDVLQEVFAAAYNAMLGDDRPINVRPWLYRIARNRCLNHMRKAQAIGVDSMDVHFSDFGASTADKVHEREEFRELVHDIAELPETQRTALVLREMDALSYQQIAEAMDTTIPSVKSLLVRARVSLAEAAEARMLTCEEARSELGAVAEGLLRKPTLPVRRHLKGCGRCLSFEAQLKQTNKALAAILPIGPVVILRQFVFTHLSHSAGSGATGAGAGTAGGSAAGGTIAGTTVAGTTMAGTTVAVGSGTGGLISAGVGAIATKAFAGLATAALVTAGAVGLDHAARAVHAPVHVRPVPALQASHALQASAAVVQPVGGGEVQGVALPTAALSVSSAQALARAARKRATAERSKRVMHTAVVTTTSTATSTTASVSTATTSAAATTTTTATSTATTQPGRIDTTPIPTVLPTSATTAPAGATPAQPAPVSGSPAASPVVPVAAPPATTSPSTTTPGSSDGGTAPVTTTTGTGDGSADPGTTTTGTGDGTTDPGTTTTGTGTTDQSTTEGGSDQSTTTTTSSDGTDASGAQSTTTSASAGAE